MKRKRKTLHQVCRMEADAEQIIRKFKAGTRSAVVRAINGIERELD